MKSPFQCEITFVDGMIEEMKVWCYKPRNIVSEVVTVDWATEHLKSCHTPEGLLKHLGIPEEVQDVKVAARGMIEGWWSGPDPEWDEAIYFTEVQWEALK